jgi:DNA mismatch repair ATPase MutS
MENESEREASVQIQQDCPAEQPPFQNILALCYSHNQLGVAGYSEMENTIYAESFEVSPEDCEATLQSIKMTFDPTLFLIHPTILTNASLLNFVLQGTDGLTPNAFNYKTLRTAAWNERITSSMIYNNLKIFSRVQGQTVVESALETVRRLGIDLDIEKVRLKQALGALLTHLQDTIFQSVQDKILIASIKEFPLIPYLRMDMNSYRALQIFSEDFHPNWINGKGRSKEGFSLFGLFDRTQSVLGKRKLREWMSKPYCDLNKILERQKGIQFIFKEGNREMLSQLAFNLKNFSDVPRLLLRIKKVEATVSDWCHLYASLTNALSIVDKIHSHKQNLDEENNADDIAFIDRLFGNCNKYVLRNLIRVMSSVIDFSRSAEERKIFIQEGYDQVLDQKREVCSKIDDYLFNAAQTILEDISILQVQCKYSCLFLL